MVSLFYIEFGLTKKPHRQGDAVDADYLCQSLKNKNGEAGTPTVSSFVY